MPQFVIECSEGVLWQQTAHKIMQAVYDAAKDAHLFQENDIKVRVQPFTHYKLFKTSEDFLHVFGYILEGRSEEQKSSLSRAVLKSLTELLPAVSSISMNIGEFDRRSYCNKTLL